MDRAPLVSVVVPVYNVERYLEECVISLLKQTYGNIEILLVDDGSIDCSGVLCDQLAGKDSRIRVLHKANGGLSDARNRGLRESSGEWISFVDSDDWISPVFIEALLRAVLNTGCEIAAVPAGKPFKDGDNCALVDSLASVALAKPLDSSCVQRLMLYQALDTGAQWRLYRKASLGNDPFPIGLYYEDLASVYRIIHRVDKIALVDCRELYAYRIRGNSIIRQDYRRIKAESALLIADQLYRDICEWYPEFADAAASRCFSLCRMVYAQLPTGADATNETKRDRFELWKALERYRVTVVRDLCARKRERLAAAVACLGQVPFNLFCKAARKAGLMQ